MGVKWMLGDCSGTMSYYKFLSAMKKLLLAARTPAILLGSVLAIEGTYLARSVMNAVEDSGVSHDLLYGSASPFQNSAFLSIAENPPPRTDVTLRTPLTPFGVGEQFRDGDFSHVVSSGDTLVSIWESLGGDRMGALAAIEAFKSARVDLRSLKAGEVITAKRYGGEIVELRRTLGNSDKLVLVGNPDGGYFARIDKVQVVEREREVSGVIMHSLVDSARGVNLPYELVDDFVDLFSNRVEFRKDLQPGDTFSVLYDERQTEHGEVVTPGAIKSASLQLGSKFYAVVRDVAADGTIRYFDEKGEMPGKYFLRYPVKYSRISSVFASSRFHPVLNTSRPHNGVDFAAPTGTPVRTIGDGVVVFAGTKSGTGNMVKIAHNSRYVTEYMHLSKIDPKVKTGARVGRGDVIGAVGQTGLATGPHLHFGLFDNGKYVDPLKCSELQSGEDVKAPAAVLARLEELKKIHSVVTMASASSDPRA
jgi:murein DD-endopeptidase MepM/ murein hydrolase activator NlpD